MSQRLSALDMAGQDADEQLKTRMPRHLIATKRARLTALLREGLLSDEIWRELNEAMNEELASLNDEPSSSNMREGSVGST